MRLTALVVALLCVAACQRKTTPAPPSAAERAEIQKLVAPVLARAQAREAERKKGLVDAARLVPRPDLGPCPIHVALPDPRRQQPGFDLKRMQREADAAERVALTPIKPEFLAKVDGPLYRAFRARLMGIENMTLQGARATLAEVPDAFWDYDVVVVQQSRSEAQRTGDGYIGGQFRGRALLWSFKDHKVLCMADVESGNSSHLTVNETRVAGHAVGDDFRLTAGVDLLQNIIRDSLAKLVLAGPPR